MKEQPILDRVIIEQDAAQSSTASGLIIPDSAKEKPLTGRIVAKGITTVIVEVGDSVLYQKYRGVEVTIHGKEYIIMREEDILSII